MTALIGAVATATGVYCMLPQVMQLFKTKETESLSLLMYIVLGIGKLLWLIYGVQIGDVSLIVCNLLNAVCAAAIIWGILRYGKRKTEKN